MTRPRAYYNEHDPFAAAWLRELIFFGWIADGDVDERSIEDVTPDDLRGYTQCHFFAGIGVWSYALRNAGWSDDRPIWTGSCPCQPFSAAGKGGGFDDERHLWPAFFHLIQQCGPAVVVGEQVASKDGLAWLDLVRADVEGTGRAFAAADLCAAGFGAPHIRQRTFWLAHADSGQPRARRGNDAEMCRVQEAKCEPEFGAAVFGRSSADVGLDDTASARHVRTISDAESNPRHETRLRLPDTGRAAIGLDDDDDARSQGYAGHDGAAGGRQEPRRSVAAAGVSGGLADATDAGRQLQPGSGSASIRTAATGKTGSEQQFGAVGAGIDGARSTSPTDGFWRDADWLFCRDGKWRPVEPGTFPLAHGSANRVGRLRGYGNAIVAPVAQGFIESVMDILP